MGSAQIRLVQIFQYTLAAELHEFRCRIIQSMGMHGLFHYDGEPSRHREQAIGRQHLSGAANHDWNHRQSATNSSNERATVKTEKARFRNKSPLGEKCQ